MRLMTAGNGYKYLLKTVAAGDGDRDMATPLTRYYASTGTPPGRWLGAGLPAPAAAAGGAAPGVAQGAEVTEAQLERLIGQGRHPATGAPLGRAYPRYRTSAERAAQRLAELDPALTGAARAAAAEAIEAEEASRTARRPVAGFDYTFSPPKSVSVLWGLADAGTQALIAQTHHQAVEDVLAFMEREVARTRTGITGRDGAVAQVPVTGLVAAGFDHWDSRAGDPQIHTHVVVSAKVAAMLDGRWRSLDSRPMHGAVVAISELYNAVLADRLARTLGWRWEARDRGRDRNAAWEVQSVPEALVKEFSSRAGGIDKETDRLIDAYKEKHGRRPSRGVIVNLRRQAALATRPVKQVRSLADLTQTWRAKAAGPLGADPARWAAQAAAPPLDGAAAAPIRADDVPLETVEALGEAVMRAVGDRRSTWRRWNLHAEASRQTMGWRFATTADREHATGLIVDAAERASIRLTPDARPVPAGFAGPDGKPVFQPAHAVLYTSQALWDAERRLLDLSKTAAGPTADPGAAGAAGPGGVALGADQAEAVAQVAVSGRVVDVLVGPAGAGKTTALAALRSVWERERGPGSVAGLAPSAAAAHVLAGELGIDCENTARWLALHDRQRAAFQKGQLVIVDEASLAGTFTLDRIAGQAARAGAKLLLVGDWAQLQAVDAGGAFNLLTADRDDAPELADVRRFCHAWEKTASLQLRRGRTEAVVAYMERGRVREAGHGQAVEGAYAAWLADTRAGLSSLLIADTAETVQELNRRARHDRILQGQVDPRAEARLKDGSRASRGDLVVTRLNDRRLRAGKTGWVRNGDRWAVVKVHGDGAVTVRRAGPARAAAVTLPAAYAAENLQLGYASTAHRAQGSTTDTAHAVVTAATTREGLYVAMTRGRQTNTCWVATDQPDPAHTQPHPGEAPAGARTILAGILQRSGAEQSAHQAEAAEREAWGNMAQLCAEHETLAAAADRDRWANLVHASGIDPGTAEDVTRSPAFGALCAELRHAEAAGHDMARVLPRLAVAQPLDGADDPAAALHARAARHTRRARPARSATAAGRWVAGIALRPAGPVPAGFREPLAALEDQIEARAAELLRQAVRAREPWLQELGPTPPDPRSQALWRQAALAAAAYRDRHQVTGAALLGAPATAAQRRDAARVRGLVNQAGRTPEPPPSRAAWPPPAARTGPAIGM
jgi:conjugative relaxase-like TrwC/TraI family protein